MKLHELFNDFLDDCSKKGRAYPTIQKHEANIRYSIGPTLGEKELDKLRLVDVSSLVAASSQRGVDGSRRTVLTFIQLMTYARACGYKLPFDLDDIEIPKKRRFKETVALSGEEIEKIRKILNPDNYKRSKYLDKDQLEKCLFVMSRRLAVFEFLLHTGLRISEALSVNRDDLNFNDPELRVRNVKTGTFAPVYFFGAEKALKDYLARRKDNNPALFVNWEGDRLTKQTVHSCMIRMARRLKIAGIKKTVNHRILRTTFVTKLLQNGCDPKETQKLARHTSLQTTLGYYYAVDDGRLKPKHKAIMSVL